MMRITSGQYKGRIIQMPKGIRPTQGLVRKALFDILGDIEGLSFLELFAGSGAVGFEALSQGAKQVVFVENTPNCLKALKNNFTYLLPTTYYLLPLDVFIAIKKLFKDKKQFNIIFLDPPYYRPPRRRRGDSQSHKEMSKKILQMLGAYDILAPNGFVVVQHFKKEQLPKESGKLTLIKESRYGDTILSFYKKRCQ
jgi:16S rRNA (guanine(966)-N(2))-methyltransferase RsmD